MAWDVKGGTSKDFQQQRKRMDVNSKDLPWGENKKVVLDRSWCLSQSDRVSTLKRSETSHIVEMACSDDELEMQKTWKVNSREKGPRIHDEIDSLFSMNSIEFLVTQATAEMETASMSTYNVIHPRSFDLISPIPMPTGGHTN